MRTDFLSRFSFLKASKRTQRHFHIHRLNIRAASHSEKQGPNQRQNHHRKEFLYATMDTLAHVNILGIIRKAEELAKESRAYPNHLTSRLSSTPMQLPAED
ncbi:hypothetical protein TNCV_3060991 [Trichonephila clavipes]|nr:hypothetical protein TNCV_3060991 [Trichonephila clavipes]